MAAARTLAGAIQIFNTPFSFRSYSLGFRLDE